jgi:hypothetical protein
MPLTIPWQFASATTNTPTIRLDQNYDSIKNWINARNPTVGLLSARPAAGNAGAIYMTSDEANTLYLDNGTAWAAAAGGGTSSAITNLLLNGGIIGTSGVGVIAMGPATAPTSSPVDTVQLYTIDWDTSGRSLQIRDERGGFCTFGSDSGIGTTLRLLDRTQAVLTDLYADTAGGGVGTFNNVPFGMWVNNGASGASIQLRTDGHIMMALGGTGSRLVTNGAPDSGGSGYRLLVITN